jgi:hypothetical protein
MRRPAIALATFLAACAGSVGTLHDVDGHPGDDHAPGDGAPADPDPVVLPAPPPPVVGSSEDHGFLSKPATVLGRDGGMATVIGGRMVWMFGDTLLTVAAADTGLTIRSSTAGRGPAGPWSSASGLLEEPVDGGGAPFEAIQFTADELAFNAANFPANGKRVAHWISGLLAAPGADQALVFFEKVDCEGASFQTRGEMWTDVLKGPAAVTDGQAAMLFGPGQKMFRPSELVDGEWAYFLASELDFVAFVYYLARAPVDRAGDATAYQFWNGTGWVGSQDGVARLPGAVMAGNAASISWNPHLGKYLMVSSAPAAIQLRVSDSPVGEWSEVVEVSDGVAPPFEGAPFGNYAGHEQPALRSEDGRTIAVSYFNPTDEFAGHVRLMTITFE